MKIKERRAFNDAHRCWTAPICMRRGKNLSDNLRVKDNRAVKDKTPKEVNLFHACVWRLSHVLKHVFVAPPNIYAVCLSVTLIHRIRINFKGPMYEGMFRCGWLTFLYAFRWVSCRLIVWFFVVNFLVINIIAFVNKSAVCISVCHTHRQCLSICFVYIHFSVSVSCLLSLLTDLMVGWLAGWLAYWLAA